jgi:tartrate dehydrogenase/decarboxylase/D-malate dehydrogenase
MAKVREHKIAQINGDGIGNEVVPEGIRVLDVAGERFGFKMRGPVPLELRAYHKTGR